MSERDGVRLPGVLIVAALSLATACAADDDDGEGPGRAVPGPCGAAVWLASSPPSADPAESCEYDYDESGHLVGIDDFEDADYNSESRWDYDGDRIAQIEVETVRGSGGWFDDVWTFESDRVVRRTTDLLEDRATSEETCSVDGFGFIGSPFECGRGLIASETILGRSLLPSESDPVGSTIEYSYDGSFEEGRRVQTGVDASTDEVVSAVTFDYDEAERLIHRVADDDASAELTIERGEAGRIDEQVEDGLGRVVLTYGYDELGNVIALHRAETAEDGRTFVSDVTYSYDCW